MNNTNEAPKLSDFGPWRYDPIPAAYDADHQDRRDRKLREREDRLDRFEADCDCRTRDSWP